MPAMTFQTFTSAPDKDGDRIEVQRTHTHYMVKTLGADGDFRMVYVSADDMLAVAKAVVASETQA